MRKILLLFFVYSITVGGSCDADPFKYANNTRIIIEGKLVNEDGSVLTNQSLKLFSTDQNNRIVIKQVFSDGQGIIFLSAPKGNNPMFIEFDNKNILSTTYYSDLIKVPGYSKPDWIGFLNDSYYDFGYVMLKDIN
jgi:hypothetical protein